MTDNDGYKDQFFHERSNIVDKSILQLPFSHPKDMSLYYKKYGLNLRGVAPFFEPEPLEIFNYDKEIERLVRHTNETNHHPKKKK